MKQKLMLLMVLVVGLAACTKEVNEDKNVLQGQKDEGEFFDQEKYARAFGEFEGVWVVDQQEIDTTKLTVTKYFFQVRFPLEYFVNFAYDNAEFKFSWYSFYSLTGFTDNMLYCDFLLDPLQQYVETTDEAKLVEATNVNVQRRNHGGASFNTDTRLWTILVPIDKKIQITTDSITITDIPPITLVYIAKKKL